MKLQVIFLADGIERHIAVPLESAMVSLILGHLIITILRSYRTEVLALLKDIPHTIDGNATAEVTKVTVQNVSEMHISCY